ncbi:MAG: helix-turn-helix domain-containing protein [Bacteroidales bacterium]|nr:helix-turn-helix domain-containing protein [Bacteroidales bacterium]
MHKTIHIRNLPAIILLIAVMLLDTNTNAQDAKILDLINDQFTCHIEGENNGEVLRKFSSFYLSTEEFQKVISYAGQLKTLGDKNNNMRYRAFANVYLGQAYLMTNQTDIANMYLNQALRQATIIGNDSILCSVYNGLGLFEANVNANFNGSIEYFYKGVEAAQRSSFERVYHILLCNISGVHYLKKDTAGLEYAQSCYNYGHSVSDPFLTLWGSVNSAKLYLLKGEYEEALKYAKEAEFLLQRNGYKDQSHIYTTYGEVLFALGQQKEAEEYYKMALEYTGTAQVSSIANLYLGYGNLLKSQNRLSQAIPYFKKGIEVSEEANNQIFTKDLYLAISQSYSGLQQYQNALYYYSVFNNLSTKFFNEERERSINRLRVEFDTQRKEIEAEQARLEVINKNRKLQFLIILLVLAVAGTTYIYLLYLHKNRLYRRIIVSNKEAIAREKELRKKIEEFKNECPGVADKYSASSLNDNKLEDIFRKLENAMSEQFLYRDPSLTKEKVAEQIGTNRTYLSQVINEKTEMNFTQYICSYRIKEAIQILSDQDDDTPLKAIAADLGFNSMSTFYKAFQTSVGMTPSLYRKKVQEFSS